ncbi:hypothetical protein DRO32_00485 [Candidatus Bathyarchaeota archaeon]|nr:MAG: hypothetical protein DRO32_00485 [Candidatus Bathyarchaeota archaeon]
MSSLLEGLVFQKRDSLLHRLDPRVKLAYALAVMVMAGIHDSLPPLLAMLLAQLPLAAIGKVMRAWAKTLRGSLPLVLLIMGTNLLFTWLQGSPITIYVVERILALAIRFLVFVASFSIFTLTTSPDDLSLALEQMGIPYSFCFMFRAALRFTPVMVREARTTMDAQRARGLELDKGGPIDRARRYIPILIPLIVNAITRAWSMAEAMESRAWGATGKRTSLYVLRLRGRDYLALLATTFSLIMALYARFYFSFPYILPYIVSLL